MPIEVFANNAQTTVPTGGTTAPAAGTTESWTVASAAGFPAASNVASPAAQFTIVDPAAQGELIRVTNVAGTTWTVTRGVEGTTPVAHTAGFTIAAIVTSAGLIAVANANQQARKPALRRWSAALADVQNNPVDVLCIGDSITEGSNSTAVALRWVDQMRDMLRAQNAVPGVAGGPNYVPVRYVTATLPAPMTVTGTPASNTLGLGFRSYDLTTTTPTITATVFGTSVKVFYLRSAAVTFSYSVDGATATRSTTT